LSNLTYLELGVDVLEFLIYDGSRSSLSVLTDTRNLGETCKVVKSSVKRNTNDKCEDGYEGAVFGFGETADRAKGANEIF
jgi:hypothetical protein